MLLPADVAEQLRAIDEDPARYEWIAESERPEFVRFFVGKLVETAALFDEWYPQLAAYALHRRREQPLLDLADTDALGHSQRRVLRPLIENAERVPLRLKRTAAIFLAPLNVLSLLHEGWPATVPNAVLLTNDEWRLWDSQHSAASEAGLWWYALQWWDIATELPDVSLWFDNGRPTFSPGSMPLFVTHGMMWGSMAGGEDADLWAWDGTRETFVEHLGSASF